MAYNREAGGSIPPRRTKESFHISIKMIRITMTKEQEQALINRYTSLCYDSLRSAVNGHMKLASEMQNEAYGLYAGLHDAGFRDLAYRMLKTDKAKNGPLRYSVHKAFFSESEE